MNDGQPSAQQVIGSRIREHRERAGLSQAELARRVYVSRQTVGNWEAGRTLADVQSLVLLARVFGVTVDDLIGRRGLSGGTVKRRGAPRARTVARDSRGTLGAAICLIFAAHLISLLAPQDGAAGALRIALDVAALACAVVLALRALPRLRSFMREHDLENAARAASYLEGRGR